MSKQLDKETFLAQWLEGHWSADELYEVVKKDQLTSLRADLAMVDQFELEGSTSDELWMKLREKRESGTPRKPLLVRLIWPLAAAAAIALVLIFVLPIKNGNQIVWSSSNGETLIRTLPDGSEVILNDASQISFNSEKWNESRALSLDGEAFFKVAKGETFTVNTSAGYVSVVGTQFNVKQWKKLLLVDCYEGKVNVEDRSDKSSILLEAKESCTNEPGTLQKIIWNMNGDRPTWIDGRSSFANVPIELAISELARQYDVTINWKTNDRTNRFTGTFVHNDLNLALEAICRPLGKDYKIQDEKNVQIE